MPWDSFYRWRDEDCWPHPEIGSEAWHIAHGPEEHDSVDRPLTMDAPRADGRSMTEPRA